MARPTSWLWEEEACDIDELRGPCTICNSSRSLQNTAVSVGRKVTEEIEDSSSFGALAYRLVLVAIRKNLIYSSCYFPICLLALLYDK